MTDDSISLHEKNSIAFISSPAFSIIYVREFFFSTENGLKQLCGILRRPFYKNSSVYNTYTYI